MEKFKKMKKAYAKSIGKGKPGLDIHGNPIKLQTRSIWFSKEKIQNILDEANSEEGGIRIFLGQYDEETIPEEFLDQKEQLVGRLTVILGACKEDEVPTNFWNGGAICPPFCSPPPPGDLDDFDFNDQLVEKELTFALME